MGLREDLEKASGEAIKETDADLLTNEMPSEETTFKKAVNQLYKEEG
jgi:hypothetical protein